MFKLNLNEISKRRYKLEEQQTALKIIKFLSESREAVIKLFNDYSLTMSEVRYKTKHGERLKILTPKQMLRRLLITLA